MEDYPTLFKKQKSHRVAPMAFENKKAMGPTRSPMAFRPSIGTDLWVTLCKIKVKEIKIRKSAHLFPLF
jgi:hypothetical protein